jgi:flagellar hook-associated protein 2
LSVSGLGSGIDWQSMLTQLTQVENQALVPIQNDQTTYSNKLAAWQSFGTQIDSLNSAAYALKYGSDFNLYTTNLSSSSSTSASSLMSATASSSATQGSYQVVVNSTAQVQKLASNSCASKTSALGITGTILVNGHAVNIAATDTLQNLADGINSQNSGTTPTNVTASIIQDTPNTYRLVLTSGTTGAAGISLQNGSASDTLTALGFNSGTGTVIKNAVSGGATSDSFSSSSTAVDALLGNSSQNLTGNVVINGKAVTIKLSDSLTTTQANLQAAGINCSIVPTTSGTTTTYKLQIAGMSSWTDNNNVLQSLGLIQDSRADVVGVTGSVGNTTDGKTAITAATNIVNIYGYNNNTAGDKVTISGTKHDGTAVAGTDLLITSSTTVNDLLSQIQNLFGPNVTASVTPDGKIQVADTATGASQLSVNLATTVQDPNGGQLNFGTFGTVGAVKKYVIQQGKDASFSVDGMAMTSSTNSVTSAIPGVTLNLLGQDPNTTVTVNVGKDTSGIENLVNTMITAYNSVVGFVNTQMSYNPDSKTTGGPLFGDNTLKSVKLQLQSLIQSKIGTSTIKYLSDVGITPDQNGQLSLNKTTFENALSSNFNDVVHLFTDYGSSTDSQLQYVGNSGTTQAGTYNVNIGVSPLSGTIDGQTATVNGNVLSLNNSASKANGLQMSYTGAAPPPAGTTFTLTRGIASLLESVTNSLTDPANGTVTVTENACQSSIDAYTKKLSDMQANIAQKMAAMQTQFQNMDTAIGKMKTMSSYLTSQINAGI